MVTGRRIAGVLAVALLVTSGCKAAPSNAPPDPGPEPTATFGFTQLIPLEGTRHALLRVVNTGDTAMVVLSVAIQWPGYPDGVPSPADPTIEPGATLDLRLELPDPSCESPGDAPAIGVVETAQGTVRHELEATGTTYLQRLWRTQCDVALVDRAVEVSYSASWQVVGTGVEARALGDLVLRRGDDDEAITVGGVDGSVLHGLRLPGPTTLPAGSTLVRIPLEITPGNRCDEHARGQATAPFDLSMRLGIGEREVPYQVKVPLPAMEAATEALDIACRARDE